MTDSGSDEPQDTALGGIAIIGMACIFPKAPDLRSFWVNILAGVDAIGFFQQGLCDHGFQRHGKHGAYHFLVIRREHIDDAIDGFGGRTGVQRTHHQVAGFRGGQCELDGFEVT